MPLQYFFIPKIYFFAAELKGKTEKRIGVKVDEKGCMFFNLLALELHFFFKF